MTIELSDKQARVMVAALDCFSRLGMGQLWAICEAIAGCKTKAGETIDVHGGWDMREKWTDAMTADIFGYGAGASHGICSPNVPDAHKIAYDLQCVIRKDIAEREEHGQSSVWRNSPLHVCRAEPLAKIISREHNATPD